ncbi:MAG: helix-turn-helix domain-containing protein [Ktedonobacteraceae bacterium]|nr:helix-turn-helix domain-containing protein [Ktedonobacteraceae bacterium]
MKDNLDLPDLPGYVSIKEAAKLLGVRDRTVYEYVEEGRLPGVRAANVIMISIKDVAEFKRNAAGRPRKTNPPWRASWGDNVQYLDITHVRAKTGQEKNLVRKLEEIRRSGRHLFAGTVVRSIARSRTEPGEVVIVLTWRGTLMPDEATRQQQLEAFRRELADVLDWSTARSEEAEVLLHT